MQSRAPALSSPERRATDYYAPYFPYILSSPFVYICICTLVPKTKRNSEYCDIGKKQDLGVSSALNPPVPTDIHCQSMPYVDMWGYHTNTT